MAAMDTSAIAQEIIKAIFHPNNTDLIAERLPLGIELYVAFDATVSN